MIYIARESPHNILRQRVDSSAIGTDINIAQRSDPSVQCKPKKKLIITSKGDPML